jgi:hypothetical protein
MRKSASCLLKLADMESVIPDALLMPMIGNEVILAIWLMVKGLSHAGV